MSGQFQIEINSGQTLYLQHLNQNWTYEGLLEGLPTAERNVGIIKRALEKAVLPYWQGKPYLIQPSETAIQYREGKKYPFGTPAALPGVTCEALFTSLFPARDKTKDHSWLIVVWFQDDFALPIDEDVAKQIVAIDWENTANDEDY